MTPLKIFLNLRNRLLAEEALAETRPDDPFHHPDVLAMSLRELADLPFPGHSRQAIDMEKPPLAKCA